MGSEAVVNDVEKRQRHGKVLARSIELAHMNHAEAAYELGKVDKGQLSRWLSGVEHPQTWRFEQHNRIGPALIQAMAEARAQDDSAVIVTTTISVRSRKKVG